MGKYYNEIQKCLDKIKDENGKIILIGDWHIRIENDVNWGMNEIEKE